MWYLHSHVVCANVLFMFLLLSGFGHRISTVSLPEGSFFVKYYSIAFVILPSIAGGLAV